MDGGHPRGVGACRLIYDAVRNSPSAGTGEPKPGAPLRIGHLMLASVGTYSRRTNVVSAVLQTGLRPAPTMTGRMRP